MHIVSEDPAFSLCDACFSYGHLCVMAFVSISGALWVGGSVWCMHGVCLLHCSVLIWAHLIFEWIAFGWMRLILSCFHWRCDNHWLLGFHGFTHWFVSLFIFLRFNYFPYQVHVWWVILLLDLDILFSFWLLVYVSRTTFSCSECVV